MTSILIALLLAAGATPAIDSPRPAIDRGARPAVEFRFRTPGCWPTGSALGSRGETITVTRASAKRCNVAAPGAAPQLVTCQTNEACVEASGLLVEPARTNLALNSDVLQVTGYWTPNTAVAPDGTTTADRITDTSPLEPYVINVTPGGGAILNRTFSLSAYCKLVTGGPQIYMGVTDTAAWASGQACQSGCTLNSSAYTRCSVTCKYTGSGASTTIGMVPFATTGRLGNPTVPAVTADCWGLQLEEGAYATSYIPTAGTSAPRSADLVYATNPLATPNPSRWCIDVTATPESGRAWISQSGSLAAWASTTTWSNTEAGDMSLTAFTDGYFYFDQVNASGTDSAARTSMSGWADGSTKRLLAAFDGPAVTGAKLTVDGALTTLSNYGTGSIGAIRGTLLIGSRQATREFGGYIRDLKLFNGPCR